MGEMCDPAIFNQSRRGWRRVVAIKDLLSDDENLESWQIKMIGGQIGERLRKFGIAGGNKIVQCFELADSYDSLNKALDNLYDMCDDHRIWVE
jgi:hypothetical protein